LAIFWIALLACSIALNKLYARCTEKAWNADAALWLLYFTILAFIPIGLYLVISCGCRYFLKIRYQSKSDANRAKLEAYKTWLENIPTKYANVSQWKIQFKHEVPKY
jgi:predicted PurR-regulated permease PerM